MVVDSWKDIPEDVLEKVKISLETINSRTETDLDKKSSALMYLFDKHGAYLGGKHAGNRAARTCGTCVSNVKVGWDNLIKKWQTSKL
jgi:hypothetical protein|tara:strand:+ start:3515 stop:3775 length:261 start_codon:yes stop_codon:yes gene_type:complete